jgi:hypothetical protein
MTPEKFVAGIKSAVFESAVTGTMRHLEEGPAGREPHPRARALSGWFSQLAAGDQQMVAECVRDAAHAAVFGFLCVLDGARVLDDPPHADLHLTAASQNGVTLTLASSSEPVDLHDEFNGLVYPPSEPGPQTS